MAWRVPSVVPTLVSASALVLAFGAGAPASAQTPSPPAPSPAAGQPKWEIEGHFGGAFGNQPSGGTPIAAFPVGEAFTSAAGRPSRYASTWYFGDGAALLNQIAAGFTVLPVTARITPLDPVLTRAALERKNGLNFGARINRPLTSRLAAEFSVDSVGRTIALSDDALNGIEATRGSFGPIWNGLIATGGGLFTNPLTVSTTTLLRGTSVRDTFLTGAVNVTLSKGTRLEPYLTGGAGVRIRSGDLPAPTVSGAYRFTALGFARIEESDSVQVHFAGKETAPVGVFGGGVKYALSSRQGLRADVRVHISPNSIDTLVGTLPTSVLSTPAFSIPSATTPSLVLSNTAAVRSNLTGPAITDLKTFTGSGWEFQTNLTVGYFVRF